MPNKYPRQLIYVYVFQPQWEVPVMRRSSFSGDMRRSWSSSEITGETRENLKSLYHQTLISLQSMFNEVPIAETVMKSPSVRDMPRKPAWLVKLMQPVFTSKKPTYPSKARSHTKRDPYVKQQSRQLKQPK